MGRLNDSKKKGLLDASNAGQIGAMQHEVIRAVKILVDTLESEGKGDMVPVTIADVLKKSVPTKHYKFLKSNL